MPITTDCLVIGSGVAGLSLALEAAAHGDVIIVTKRAAEESNTKYAQGGIAAVLSTEDSFDAHIADTLQAGAGLCHELAVEVCVKEGPARIQALQDLGAHFDRAGGDVDLDLHLEGGHSRRRVAHAADMTGREVERVLLEAVRKSPNIRVLENHMAVDLITLAKYGGPEKCAGAYVLDEASEIVLTIVARAVVLASGALARCTSTRRIRTWLRGRSRDGLPGRRRSFQYGILSIPPHVFVPPQSPSIPAHRGAARGGRCSSSSRRNPVHEAL